MIMCHSWSLQLRNALLKKLHPFTFVNSLLWSLDLLWAYQYLCWSQPMLKLVYLWASYHTLTAHLFWLIQSHHHVSWKCTSTMWLSHNNYIRGTWTKINAGLGGGIAVFILHSGLRDTVRCWGTRLHFSVSNENKVCKKLAEIPPLCFQQKIKHPTQSHAISFCLDRVTEHQPYWGLQQQSKGKEHFSQRPCLFLISEQFPTFMKRKSSLSEKLFSLRILKHYELVGLDTYHRFILPNGAKILRKNNNGCIARPGSTSCFYRSLIWTVRRSRIRGRIQGKKSA